MHFWSPLVLAALASSASASILNRAVCNADNCYRAVQASSAKPGASSARQDCSSFMVKTVTLSAATTTTTSIVTVTAPTPTSLVSQQVAVTDTLTSVQTLTIVNTVVDTVTVFSPSAIVVPTTVVVPVTVTGVAPGKRDHLEKAAEGYYYIAPDGNVKRAAQVTSSVANGVPVYASACSGTVRYSSACSCAGVTASTVTTSQSTSTATATSTVTVTPAAAAVTTYLTVTQPVTVTVTQTVPATFETTAATAIVPSVYTRVQPVTVLSTVIVASPACSSFVLQAGAGGPHAGTYAYASDDDANIAMISDPGTATKWHLNSNGRVVRADTGASPWGSGDRGQFVYSAPDFNLGFSNYQDLVCALGPAPNLGELTCTTTAGAITLQTCTRFDQASGEVDIYQNVGLDQTWRPCYALHLMAIPAC